MREDISLEEAIDCIVSSVQFINNIELVSLYEALGRVSAVDFYAQLDMPPFDRSPIDGYACRSEDLQDASSEHPVILRVVEEVDAGGWYKGSVQHGECVRIMTGAAIPDECDCVQWQEKTDYGENQVRIYAPCKYHENYSCAGTDFKKGDLMLEKGRKLDYIGLSILSSLGQSKVSVYKKPKIALFTTGDEVVTHDEMLSPGKIYNTNQALVYGRLKELGYEPVIIRHLSDDADSVIEAIQSAVTQVDLIVTTGGVSVGKKDIMHDVMTGLSCDPLFWKVRLKPGSPTIYAVYKGMPILCLTGNPFGVVVNVELLLRPLLGKLSGDDVLYPQIREATLKNMYPKVSRSRRFLRARYTEEGEVYLPEGSHEAGTFASMKDCNCLLEIPEGSRRLKGGERLKVILI